MSSGRQTTCDICRGENPELCCTTCDSRGLPYHEQCWEKERSHNAERQPPHIRTPFQDLERLRYITEPNQWTSVDDKVFKEDDANCFIEFDTKSQKFQFGPRASCLLRSGSDQVVQYPSFVSFIGRTANGKSFLLRALQHGAAANNLPTPVPAAGRKDNHGSTSSDIHLYADWRTAECESPILFLDCEGFDGSDAPSSYLVKAVKSVAGTTSRPGVIANLRREYVENMHPRLIYTFSTCIVFVTSGPLAESASIGRRLLSYAHKSAGGSQNQGFKPSLFIIFNHFRDGQTPGFDWSTKSSTEKFLAFGNAKELELFYDTIRVIYIPSVLNNQSPIALSQIDALQTLLREDHDRALLRRKEFRLIFTPDQLSYYVWRALELFSQSHNSVFNWSMEATCELYGSELDATYQDLWNQCASLYASATASTLARYVIIRNTFMMHVEFCFLLLVTRKPPLGVHVRTIPKSLEGRISMIDQILLTHAPCGARSQSGVECLETQYRHQSHHQGLKETPLHRAVRWRGQYRAYEKEKFRTFREVFQDGLNKDGWHPVTLSKSVTTLPPAIFSLKSCLGCLQGTPSAVLACGHAFCLDCIRDLAMAPALPHRLKGIHCPFHKSLKAFSPRILPVESGYRILSLDGGGVKGLAQLVTLKHIEKKCFNIPMVQLFDLIVGTSIGGQIALALTAAMDPSSLTVESTTEKFKELMESGFVRKLRSHVGMSWFMGKSKYKKGVVERKLQDLFGKDTRLYGVASSHPILPHVAVTTVMQDSFKPCLVANYNRDTIPAAYPLLLTSNIPECMPVWAAARCTSAAFPYFKPFQWQGQMLLDGGFRLNCPAAAAFAEAKSIWPEKRCDILLSLGTGKPTCPNQPSSHSYVRLLTDITEAVLDTEDVWDKFVAATPQKKGIFRLNPVYKGAGFEFDDFKKLDKIQKQTEAWLDTRDIQVTYICDQLLAALFFFVPNGPINNSVQMGHILCRLPTYLGARQSLFNGMRQQHDMGLFSVQFIGNPRRDMEIDVTGSLRAVQSGEELRIPLWINDLAEAGEITIQIKMRSLFGGTSFAKWSEISGSPYILHGGVSGTNSTINRSSQQVPGLHEW